MALVTVFLLLAYGIALRYDMPFPFWTVVFSGIFENFHATARDVDFRAVSSQGLSCHQTNACTTSSDKADIVLDREDILNLQLVS